MPVTNTDGIIGVANTLSSITSNPYELGVDAVALASNKSLELTNTLLNFGPTTQLKTLNQASTLIMDNMASSMIVIYFLNFFLKFYLRKSNFIKLRV
jgi:hypothetical protein